MFKKSKKLVLLVEPDEFLADIYKKNLEMEGYEVLLSSSAESAFKLAEKKKPAVIVTEISLKDIDGFAFVEALKKSKKTALIPVFFVTKLGGTADVAKGRRLGVKGFIIKQHFKPSEVVDKIKAAVGV